MYYECPYCRAPLKVVRPADQPRRPFIRPQIVFCPYCGPHLGPPDARRLRIDLWRNLGVWLAVTLPVLVLYAAFALWGPVVWADRLLIALDACLVAGFPAALVVTLVHRLKARRILKQWLPYRRVGEPPERENELRWAA